MQTEHEIERRRLREIIKRLQGSQEEAESVEV
jgi:hypothetical protein